MAAIFPALSHVLYFAVPSSRSSAPLSPFCAALVQDHDDPGAVAISPAMIHSCASTISNSKCSPDYPWLQWPQPSLAGPPLQKPETVAEDPCPNFTSSRVADWSSDMPTFGLGTAREQAM
ncbi:hypothetical protein H101_07726 [Trichophyton interdigitale H6]|nr:hypothetical protein H101_07726 [Trichophyton interdigitale H6]